MSTPRILTAAAYCAAFATWRGLSRGAVPRPTVGAEVERFDALIAGGCAAPGHLLPPYSVPG